MVQFARVCLDFSTRLSAQAGGPWSARRIHTDRGGCPMSRRFCETWVTNAGRESRPGCFADDQLLKATTKNSSQDPPPNSTRLGHSKRNIIPPKLSLSPHPICQTGSRGRVTKISPPPGTPGRSLTSPVARAFLPAAVRKLVALAFFAKVGTDTLNHTPVNPRSSATLFQLPHPAPDSDLSPMSQSPYPIRHTGSRGRVEHPSPPAGAPGRDVL